MKIYKLETKLIYAKAKNHSFVISYSTFNNDNYTGLTNCFNSYRSDIKRVVLGFRII